MGMLQSSILWLYFIDTSSRTSCTNIGRKLLLVYVREMYIPYHTTRIASNVIDILLLLCYVQWLYIFVRSTRTSSNYIGS